ncbi:ATPase [Pseudomonas coronafaciens pv. zizaniae]|uniref:cell division protein ZapE n=1 Tax=Pseudomonas coronafaciens TaxID=53409 RepID=UPI000EFFCD2D|nr:cell division protein ZapE [Pseudomonas coronafaciens]RMN25479.1 ATPase [Pseudomonas coronafaciens pv. zizaniae]
MPRAPFQRRLSLAQPHLQRLAITAVPTLDGESIDVQQRFLNLIDILYDSCIELILITEEGPQALLTATALLD